MSDCASDDRSKLFMQPWKPALVRARLTAVVFSGPKVFVKETERFLLTEYARSYSGSVHDRGWIPSVPSPSLTQGAFQFQFQLAGLEGVPLAAKELQNL